MKHMGVDNVIIEKIILDAEVGVDVLKTDRVVVIILSYRLFALFSKVCYNILADRKVKKLMEVNNED